MFYFIYNPPFRQLRQRTPSERTTATQATQPPVATMTLPTTRRITSGKTSNEPKANKNHNAI